MFNRTAFGEVCTRAGFSMRELALIYGTTRQTIYDWRQGSSPTQLALAQRETAATKALTSAIAKKLLPFPESLAAVTRKARVDTIIQNIMESMKPGRG